MSICCVFQQFCQDWVKKINIKILIPVQTKPGLKDIKLFFMLSSAETKLYPAHKCLDVNNS